MCSQRVQRFCAVRNPSQRVNLKGNSPVWRLSPRRWPPRWAAHVRPWLRVLLAHALWGSPGLPTHTWSLATTTLSASPYSLPSLGTDTTRCTSAPLARWHAGEMVYAGLRGRITYVAGGGATRRLWSGGGDRRTVWLRWIGVMMGSRGFQPVKQLSTRRRER